MNTSGPVAPIVVVGDLVTDVVVRPETEPEADTDTAARVLVGGGGSAANVAAWLAAQGAPVLLVARVGDDSAGRERVAELRAAGVRTAVTFDAEHPTGAIVVLVNQRGRRTMLTDRGAAGRLRPKDLPRQAFSAGGMLCLSGYTLLGEQSRPAGLAALALAGETSMRRAVTAASAAPLRLTGAERFLDWTAGAELCVANRDEAAALLGDAEASGDELALALSARYPDAVVTLGAEGALWARDGRLLARHAPEAGPVRDTTGAGDAFTAGLLAAWRDVAAPEACLATGVRLAARAVTRAGGRPG